MEKSNDVNEDYVLEKYRDAIKYYWNSCIHNKKAYKYSKFLIISLGSLITLISSLSASSFIKSTGYLETIFAIATPVLAAILSVVGGFSQSFHWGATWRDMAVNAEVLQKELDLFIATKPEDRNLKSELDKIHGLVIDETKSFFSRVLEGEVKPSENGNGNA